ncbi:hypothetical protein KEM52_001698, partial [Ascosphaera acerosa]
LKGKTGRKPAAPATKAAEQDLILDLLGGDEPATVPAAAQFQAPAQVQAQTQAQAQAQAQARPPTAAPQSSAQLLEDIFGS